MNYEELENDFFIEMTEEKKLKVYENFKNLITYMINKKYPKMPYDEMQELTSEGHVGLMKALKGFDPSKTTRFSTFAYICIDNEIKMYLRRNQKCFRATGFNEMSLDNTIKGTNMYLDDLIGEDEAFVEHLMDSMVCDLVFAELERDLRKKDLELLEMFFLKNMTQKEIAEHLGISQSGVSKKIKRLTKKIRTKGGVLNE